MADLLFEKAASLDRTDPLARFRAEFHSKPGEIYLDGNSLGLLSRRAEATVQHLLTEWRALGINGWTDGQPPWIGLADEIAQVLGPLIGAQADQICVTGSTTANLHQLLATLFDPTDKRRIILGDALNFSSDAHAITSHLRLRGLDPDTHYREVKSRDGRTLNDDDIIAAMTPDVQLAVLPAVLFTSGQLLEIGRLTREAHARGVLIGWDCSHSIGAVPHALEAAGADFAFWCSYKYLNAGPGAVGGLFLHRRHHSRGPGMAGWWGVKPERRFSMSHQHEPANGAAALQIGTPHLLSLAPLRGSLEIITEAGGIAPLRTKSLALTSFLMEAIDELLPNQGFTIVTPREEVRRGGHVALAHPGAWQICQALKSVRVIPDFRPPDVIRLAPAPLYNTFTDCIEAVRRLRKLVDTDAHRAFPPGREIVT
ncbi:MAG: kynureninase [Candidatus Didemnitutus sp.]|nr:kynureninase [Candidatus Didemnitutus sp.]